MNFLHFLVFFLNCLIFHSIFAMTYESSEETMFEVPEHDFGVSE
ncbi:uncharacterized protein CELE_K12H6.10 [Caenorhabditis elegans]|uniref:Uncharacterized protein n=1 Tax=Caenorhabditis elegans TaxID=6239 RepID=Q4W5T3_CAEEL|nr:Uncharacterized protein CELE_K12H6.10 [Caenorhabditis elegans]CCD72964.1 Uncharacterized protein CELE_K12H6.10 [Caenorhabditis elegans]|eukprot:NP_494373.1 Uncharacterized protein CELE_K12H6.10 [Caenorhabditis elegans]